MVVELQPQALGKQAIRNGIKSKVFLRDDGDFVAIVLRKKLVDGTVVQTKLGEVKRSDVPEIVAWLWKYHFGGVAEYEKIISDR